MLSSRLPGQFFGILWKINSENKMKQTKQHYIYSKNGTWHTDQLLDCLHGKFRHSHLNLVF